jgi:hypothetical protein
MTQAAAAAKGEATATAAKAGAARKAASGRANTSSATLAVTVESRLERKLAAVKKHRSVVRFFDRHRWLLSSSEHRATARRALRRATHRLEHATRTVAGIRRLLARQETRRKADAPPRVAICDVFGRRHCKQAISVSWCESRHRTTARNGQYLGLFQMGWSERRIYGHGSTARRQALAAHRYFVASGRDWSPWSCKPWFSY